MVSVQEALFSFPRPPSSEAIEWPGEPLGRSNVITRTRSRTKLHDKTIDATPGRREHLFNAAIAHLVRHRETAAFLHDVVIHGLRVRAITNSSHLNQFWRDNWFSPEEWTKVTGFPAPPEPAITVYALGGVPDEPEAAYYSRETNTIIFFNTAYYGQLKSWVLGAVGRVLAAEFGIHSIHGAAVQYKGEGVLYIAPTGTGKSTSSYGLMSVAGTRFHSDDWVYVRYARATRDGRLVLPVSIQSDADGGEVARGFACNPWIDAHPDATGTARCLGLDNEPVTVRLEDLDRRRPVQAYAYTSERHFYLRSNLVESFPACAPALLQSDLENVASVSNAFLKANAATIDAIVDELRAGTDPEVGNRIGALPAPQLARLVASLFAFDNSRAMLDIRSVFPSERVVTNPMEPLRLSSVFLLKRDPSDPVVLTSLSLDRFMERLLVGATPDGKREIAYNAYRAVDDDAEQRAVRRIEAISGEHATPLYQAFRQAPNLPESLVEEFSLFRQLYDATRCYDCNTILQRDPTVATKQEAVRRTLGLIVAGIDNRAADLRLTLDNYSIRAL
jgi:hypothetical protein